MNRVPPPVAPEPEHEEASTTLAVLRQRNFAPYFIGNLFSSCGTWIQNIAQVLLIPPIPMPAALFVALYGALELFLGVTGLQTGVAHFAHLGGMLGGALMLRHFWARRRP